MLLERECFIYGKVKTLTRKDTHINKKNAIYPYLQPLSGLLLKQQLSKTTLSLVFQK